MTERSDSNPENLETMIREGRTVAEKDLLSLDFDAEPDDSAPEARTETRDDPHALRMAALESLTDFRCRTLLAYLAGRWPERFDELVAGAIELDLIPGADA